MRSVFFENPAKLCWNELKLARNRAEFGGPGRTRTARVITKGLSSLHRLARATVTFASDHSHQKPRSSNWLKFSQRRGFLVRVSRPAGLPFTPPDSTLLRVLPWPESGSVPVPPDSALWPSTKAVRLHVHPTTAHNKLRSLHMLRKRAGNVFKAISIS